MKNTRKYLALLLVGLMLATSLAACSDDDYYIDEGDGEEQVEKGDHTDEDTGDKANPDNEYPEGETSDNDDSDGETSDNKNPENAIVDGGTSDDDNSDDEITDDNESDLNVTLLNEALYIAGKNGYAWVNDDGRYHCISTKDGTVTVTLPEEFTPVSYFYNGYSLVTDGKPEQATLINYKGEEIFSAASLGVTGIQVYRKLVKGAMGSSFEYTLENGFLEAGYLIVYTIDESFDGVSYQLGVVDLEGNWVHDLSADHPILTATCNGRSFNVSEQEILTQIIYAGENKAVFKVDPWGSFGIYDLETNEVSATIYYDDCHAEFDEGITFIDGVARYTFDYLSGTNGYESITTDGVITIVSSKDGLTGKRYIGGWDDFNPIPGKAFFTEGTWNEHYLWDLDGKLVRDFSEYNFSIYGDFIDGNIPAVITNAEGNDYLTVVDQDGAFVFEPLKVDEFGAIVQFDGQYVIIKSSKSSGPYMIYDIEGNFVMNFSAEYTVTDLQNGIIQAKEYEWMNEFTYFEVKAD